MTRWVWVLVAIATSTGVCMALGSVVDIDPMLPGELAAALIVCGWALILGHDLWSANRLGRELAHRSRPAAIGTIRYFLVAGGGAIACVIGGFRPRTYLSTDLLTCLTTDELRAVVLHEEYHRMTWAPLRGAALRAWARLLGQSALVRRLVSSREDELERQADRYALAHGVSRGAIARALLKTDLTFSGSGFAGHGESRVGALLDAGSSEYRPSGGRAMPYEWLPLAVLVVIWLGCHIG